jgi:endonuclease/exonuclease/phosphatase family metal-dependent hydrolase
MTMKATKSVAGILSMAAGTASAMAQPAPTTTLLTYNVKGLPWPIASERSAALNSIAEQLLALRRQGRQPHLVALQEAFVPEAKAIGRVAGYRYEAYGPPQSEAPQSVATAQDRRFLGDASFMLGERAGKRVDSGLAIFSDYPIVAVRRMVYPVCAGYDCLANKGALAVLIAVPGLAAPLTVIDTHLNSGTASGAPRARSTYAYRRQVEALRVFISSVAPSGSGILLAGDFNVGNHADRRGYFFRRMLGSETGLFAVEQACGRGMRCAAGSPGGVAESIRHGKDWLLYRASGSLMPKPTDLAAPFGRAADGSMLSDHIGVTVTYSFNSADRPVTHRLEVATR